MTVFRASNSRRYSAGFEWGLDGSASYLYALGWLILCLVAARTIVASPFGLALQGIRENETRMRVLGSPVQMQLAIAYVDQRLRGGACRRHCDRNQRFRVA